jgi:hypothetical protein
MISIMAELASAVIAASVAVIVAILTPRVTSLQQRRQAINDKLDSAIASVLVVQAARHYASTVHENYTAAWSDDERRAYRVRLSVAK